MKWEYASTMKNSNTVLIVVLIVQVISGYIVFPFVENEQQMKYWQYTMYLIHALQASIWANYYSDENDIDINRLVRVAVAFFPHIGIPIFFLNYFGFKVGLIKILKTLAFFAGCTAILALGMLIRSML